MPVMRCRRKKSQLQLFAVVWRTQKHSHPNGMSEREKNASGLSSWTRFSGEA